MVNDGGKTVRYVELDPAADLAAYDQLPAPVRQLFQHALTLWECQGALEIVREARALGLPLSAAVNFIKNDMLVTDRANARACYGDKHPQANPSAPRSFFSPLQPKRRIGIRSRL